MAEFLIKAVSVINIDTIKDQRGCYKRGDVVVVMPDNHIWGIEERLPKFVIVKIPGLAVDLVKKYIDTHMEPRLQTDRWVKSDWDKALIANSFAQFLSKPVVINQGSGSRTIIVSNDEWAKMQLDNNYYPFSIKPSDTIGIEVNDIKLTGIVDFVDLQGDVMTPLVKRKWRILTDNLPVALKNKLLSNGEITVTWTQIKSFVQNKLTGLTE